MSFGLPKASKNSLTSGCKTNILVLKVWLTKKLAKKTTYINLTFSRPIEAVSPEVNMATTSGSGLGTGRRCLAGTFIRKM
jgi:hypothetical protein